MRLHGHEILLSGIVGSTAYGLAAPGSDIDRLGIFVAPTSAFHGLHFPKETHAVQGPGMDDFTIHEARKWCKLALGCNPTVMELVWLPDELIEVTSDWGEELRSIRSCFLSADRVRDAYLGYAFQQLKRLQNRDDGTFGSDLRKRTAKHARHLYRLCHQGLHLYRTGRLEIRLDPDAIMTARAFGERVAAGDIPAAREMIKGFEQKFDAARTPLGDRPDEERVDRWLRAVRHAYWKESDDVHEVQRRDATHHAELLARRAREGRAVDRGRYLPHAGSEGPSAA